MLSGALAQYVEEQKGETPRHSCVSVFAAEASWLVRVEYRDFWLDLSIFAACELVASPHLLVLPHCSGRLSA